MEGYVGLDQLLRDKRGLADAGEAGPSSSNAFSELECPLCHELCDELHQLMEHVDEEHSFGPARVVHCPVCKRQTKSLMQHLMQHAQLLSGYASCASSSSQPSTSRATCSYSMQEWGKATTTCCSELSFCTTVEDASEAHADECRLEAKSACGSEATDAAAPAAPGVPAVPGTAIDEAAETDRAAKPDAQPAKKAADSAAKRSPRFYQEQRTAFVRQLLLSALDLDGS